MPIKALTRGPRLPQIATLRKGAPKTDRAPGRELPHWRFVTTDAQLAKDFVAVYGQQPTEVECILAGKTIDETFDCWREAYTTGSLLHRCDGERCVLLLQPNKKGYDRWPLNDENAPPCPGGCKQVGRLHVVIPSLKRAGIVVVQTTSVNDLLSIGGTLAYCEQVTELNKILFRLARVAHEISTPQLNQQGGRIRVTKHLIELQPHPSWVERQLAIDPSGDMAALPPMRPLALEEADDGEEDEPDEVETANVTRDFTMHVERVVTPQPVEDPEFKPDFGTADADSSPWEALAMTPEQYEEAAATGSLEPDPPETTRSQPVAARAAPPAQVGTARAVATPAGSQTKRAPLDPADVRKALLAVVGEALTINRYLELDVPIIEQPPEDATVEALKDAGKKQVEYITYALETTFDQLHLDVKKMPTLGPSPTPDKHRAYRQAFAVAVADQKGVRDYAKQPRVVVD